MTRARVIQSCGALAAAVFVCVWSDLAVADAPRVLVFQGGRADKVVTNALPRVAAELRIDGTAAEVLGFVAGEGEPSPGESADTADAERAARATIAAAAERDAASGALLLWPVESTPMQPRQVQVSTYDSARRTWLHQMLTVGRESDAAAVLAVQAAEALRGHFLRRRYEPVVVERRLPAPTEPTATAALHQPVHFRFGMGASARGQADTTMTTVAPLLAAGLVWQRWSATVFAAPTSTDATVVDARAQVAVRERLAYAELAYALTSPAHALVPYVAAKVGAAVVDATGASADPSLMTSRESLVTTLVGAGGGLQCAFARGWQVALDAAAIAFASRAVVMIDEVERQRLGRPRLQLSLTLSFVM